MRGYFDPRACACAGYVLNAPNMEMIPNAMAVVNACRLTVILMFDALPP